jgi:hypothetical protein
VKLLEIGEIGGDWRFWSAKQDTTRRNRVTKKYIQRLQEVEALYHVSKRLTVEEITATLASMANAALSNYPEVLTETLAHLSSGHLGDAKSVLEHVVTGKEEDYIVTPRAVGGVLHLLMHGALDTSGNIADRIREPIIEYCGDNDVLKDTIVLLLFDLAGDGWVFRDYPVAFACVCLNSGHAFLIDERRPNVG